MYLYDTTVRFMTQRLDGKSGLGFADLGNELWDGMNWEETRDKKGGVLLSSVWVSAFAILPFLGLERKPLGGANIIETNFLPSGFS